MTALDVKISLNRATAGLAESNACGDMSSAVRHSAQEPAEGIAQVNV